jgi:hypothetical protein
MKTLSIIGIILSIVSIAIGGLTAFIGLYMLDKDDTIIFYEFSLMLIGIGVSHIIITIYFFIFSILSTGKAFKKNKE